MWQEDLTVRVGRALGRTEVVLVRTPVHHGGDWATLPMPPTAQPTGVGHEPAVQRSEWEQGRLVLTLTDTARGQVVGDVLTGRAPAPAPSADRHTEHGSALALATAGTEVPHLYPVRLAYARTAMLLRQGVAHHVLPDGPPQQVLARYWQDLAPGRTEDTTSRQLLLTLASSHLARSRSRAQGRVAPVVGNLRHLAAVFTEWFEGARCTPRGSPPGPEAPIMETYRLNLALAAATGLTLRTGLTDLGLTAPEYL